MHDTVVGRRLQTAASEEIFPLHTFVKDNRKSTSRKNGRSGYYIKTGEQGVKPIKGVVTEGAVEAS